jgi:predicted hydrocarbon binding protein
MKGTIFTNGGQYEDSKLINMVVALYEKISLAVESLTQEFGEYLFTSLYSENSVESSKTTSLREFLLVLYGDIHVEVKRLHLNAYLPKVEYEEGEKKSLIMCYSSKHKLCHVSLELISGAAKYYKEKITIKQPECMHHGAERCKLISSFEG